jgi:hypothetical protein
MSFATEICAKYRRIEQHLSHGRRHPVLRCSLKDYRVAFLMGDRQLKVRFVPGGKMFAGSIPRPRLHRPASVKPAAAPPQTAHLPMRQLTAIEMANRRQVLKAARA